MHNQQYSCWFLGAKAPDYQYRPCWITIAYIGPVSYRSIAIIGNGKILVNKGEFKNINTPFLNGESALTQATTCFMAAPSHYLNKYWPPTASKSLHKDFDVIFFKLFMVGMIGNYYKIRLPQWQSASTGVSELSMNIILMVHRTQQQCEFITWVAACQTAEE